MRRVRSQIAQLRETAVRVMRDTGRRRLAEESSPLLTSFVSYMRLTGRYGPRTRWRDAQGRWHVRGRVERFLEPALLLLLSERPAHGYELVDRVPDLVPGERPELGGL